MKMKIINTSQIDKKNFEITWSSLLLIISEEKSKVPYSGLIIASVYFDPIIRVLDCHLIVLAVMRLLYKYAYTTHSSNGKFTIGYIMRDKSSEVISFTIGAAITFRYNGIDQPVYALVEKLVRTKAEEYDDNELNCIYIRIYHIESNIPLDDIPSDDIPSDKEIASKVWESIQSKERVVEPKEDILFKKSKRRYPKYIEALKPIKRPKQPFIVADTETILVNDVHVPYAVGFLVVRPGLDLSSETFNKIETYFSEDYPVELYETLEVRSHQMLFDFIERLASIVRKYPSIKTVYFHNFSRFDGIILLKYLATHGVEYRFIPIMRNRMLYEIALYRGKKFLFRIKDTLLLLPYSLNSLAKNICPELGSKLVLEHNKVLQENLIPQKQSYINYMKQDILLLGGVMLKVQDMYWTQYQVDIVTIMTLSSLALRIFRTIYYDQKNRPIYIPNRNTDSFIRKGYYGGHADCYIPYGENLYSYDVNSLYPFIMKTYAMPGGKPVWHNNLLGQDLDNLDNLVGFIEAYVECPKTIKRPFLPYRDKNNTLIFPTGKFLGVYYSEELKYARGLGYTVFPLSGYLFEKMESPFREYVSQLYESRLEAKNAGNEALSFVYKILMNSLYGRFGINPKYTVSEICDQDKYKKLIKTTEFIHADKLSESLYIVSYWKNTEQTPDSGWSPPRISAVQMSAAITACARIHMYPYISRPDCYYTDTDSVVLGNPLPEDVISSTELGKFKCEYIGRKCIFLAPKCYSIMTTEGQSIIKHKGIAKSLVDEEWFESQYDDITRIKRMPVVSNFRINWDRLDIIKKDIQVTLGIRDSNKRNFVIINKKWVDTEPIDVLDYASQERKILEYKMKKENDIYRESLAQKDRLITHLKSQLASITSQKSDTESSNNQSYSTQNNDNPKKDKGKKKKKPPRKKKRRQGKERK